MLSVIAFPNSDFLLISFLRRSPMEMQDQAKYSARANAFSFLPLPGGPTMKILLAISGVREKVKLTFRLGEFGHEEVKRLIRTVDYQLFQQIFKQLIYLVVF
jgi:hypothetical protein